MNKKIPVKIFIILIGLTSFIFGLYFLSSKLKLNKTGEKVKGIVVEIGKERNSDHEMMYYPIVKFSDKLGKEHTVRMLIQYSSPTWSVGDAIDLIYPKGDVKSVGINSIFWIYIFPSIFILVGLFWLRVVYSIDHFFIE